MLPDNRETYHTGAKPMEDGENIRKKPTNIIYGYMYFGIIGPLISIPPIFMAYEYIIYNVGDYPIPAFNFSLQKIHTISQFPEYIIRNIWDTNAFSCIIVLHFMQILCICITNKAFKISILSKVHVMLAILSVYVAYLAMGCLSFYINMVMTEILDKAMMPNRIMNEDYHLYLYTSCTFEDIRSFALLAVISYIITIVLWIGSEGAKIVVFTKFSDVKRV